MKYLQEMKTTDFKNDKYLILPIGSIEQHGPFLPVGTDHLITNYLVEAIHDVGKDLVVMPSIPYSCSSEHRGFPGTVWIEEDTMIRFLSEICHSVEGFADTVFLFSFHGGNRKALSAFEKEWNSATPKGVEVVILDPCDTEMEDFEREILEGEVDVHAGNGEISMMLGIQEGLVDKRYESYPKCEFDQELWRKKGICVKDISENGILDNNPRWVASCEKGKKTLEKYAKKLSAQIMSFIENQ